MRQKNDKSFAESLNRLAKGQTLEHDIESFQGREIDPPRTKIPDCAVYLFRLCNDIVMMYIFLMILK